MKRQCMTCEAFEEHYLSELAGACFRDPVMVAKYPEEWCMSWSPKGKEPNPDLCDNCLVKSV